MNYGKRWWIVTVFWQGEDEKTPYPQCIAGRGTNSHLGGFDSISGNLGPKREEDLRTLIDRTRKIHHLKNGKRPGQFFFIITGLKHYRNNLVIISVVVQRI
jgi:hypothetical protein